MLAIFRSSNTEGSRCSGSGLKNSNTNSTAPSIIKGKTIELSSPFPRRDFVYVSDVIEAIETITNAKILKNLSSVDLKKRLNSLRAIKIILLIINISSIIDFYH